MREFEYVTEYTQLPDFSPVLNMMYDEKNLSSTTKLLFGLLVRRTMLSQKNKMMDERGKVYISIRITHFQKILIKE